jgi:hypothetical protein
MTLIKFSRASSRVKWLKVDKTDVSVSLRTMTQKVLETSVLSTFNHLSRLEARENFIKLSRRESLKSYITDDYFLG